MGRWVGRIADDCAGMAANGKGYPQWVEIEGKLRGLDFPARRPCSRAGPACGMVPSGGGCPQWVGSENELRKLDFAARRHRPKAASVCGVAVSAGHYIIQPGTLWSPIRNAGLRLEFRVAKLKGCHRDWHP
jgi:hypothetical protein